MTNYEKCVTAHKRSFRDVIYFNFMKTIDELLNTPKAQLSEKEENTLKKYFRLLPDIKYYFRYNSTANMKYKYKNCSECKYHDIIIRNEGGSQFDCKCTHSIADIQNHNNCCANSSFFALESDCEYWEEYQDEH